MKVIHLTDPHLVPPGRRLYGLDPNERLAAAISDIAANHADAALTLVTGDLAHHGESAAYAALREALDRLPMPWHLLIGNHDDRPAFTAAFPEVALDDHGFVQSVVTTSACSFVLLDTHEPGTDGGVLCERRLAWLDRVLAEAENGVVLAMHHPPLALGLAPMDAIGLEPSTELAAVLARHGNVRHILFGHVHRPVHGAWNGIPFSTHRGLNHQVALHGEVAPGGVLGSHEPPAYGIVLIEPASITVHVHDFLDASPRFDLFDQGAEGAQDPLGL